MLVRIAHRAEALHPLDGSEQIHKQAEAIGRVLDDVAVLEFVAIGPVRSRRAPPVAEVLREHRTDAHLSENGTHHAGFPGRQGPPHAIGRLTEHVAGRTRDRQPAAVCKLHQLQRRLVVRCQRLFRVKMAPRFEARTAHRMMRARIGQIKNKLGIATLKEGLHAFVHPDAVVGGKRLAAPGVDVAGCDQLERRMVRQRLHIEVRHVSAADDGSSHGGHPCWPRNNATEPGKKQVTASSSFFRREGRARWQREVPKGASTFVGSMPPTSTPKSWCGSAATRACSSASSLIRQPTTSVSISSAWWRGWGAASTPISTTASKFHDPGRGGRKEVRSKVKRARAAPVNVRRA